MKSIYTKWGVLCQGILARDLPLETDSIFKAIVEDLSLKSCILAENPKNSITGETVEKAEMSRFYKIHIM